MTIICRNRILNSIHLLPLPPPIVLCTINSMDSVSFPRLYAIKPLYGSIIDTCNGFICSNSFSGIVYALSFRFVLWLKCNKGEVNVDNVYNGFVPNQFVRSSIANLYIILLM